jgi:trehalose 6-phosphate synthase/phosphatase
MLTTDAGRLPEGIVDEVIAASGLVLLLDYDGTLVPIADVPNLAVPNTELIELLRKVAARQHTTVHLVSGRPAATLEAWFGGIPMTLWAEHGFCRRSPDRHHWESLVPIPDAALSRVLPTLELFTGVTPGSFLERKGASVAWHYRQVEPQFGTHQAERLRAVLGEELAGGPLEVLTGSKVIEVRLRGVTKAIVSRTILEPAFPNRAIVAIGDDRTDEEMFAALPPEAITISVGRSLQRARFHVDSPHEVRSLLWRLAS